jgi:hypothetical protein
MGRLTGLKNRSQSVLGLFTVVCGFLMMWGSVRTGRDRLATIESVSSQAMDIDPTHPSALNNGRLVVAAAEFSSEETLGDEYLLPAPYLILRRHVEMYQWKENVDPLSGDLRYDLGWHEGQIDFFTFRQTAGHENPLLRLEPAVMRVSSSRFGGFDGGPILRSIQKLLPLELDSGKLKDPLLRIEDNKIVIPRDAQGSGTTLGDMRVWYEVLPQGGYTILTRQVDERSLLGAQGTDTLIIRQGLFSAGELERAETGDAQDASDGLLLLGATILCLGLFSVLLPIAPRIDLRPRLNMQGKAALLVVCAGVSCIAAAVMWLLG